MIKIIVIASINKKEKEKQMKKLNQITKGLNRVAILRNRNYSILFCTDDIDCFITQIEYYAKSGKVVNNVGILSNQLMDRIKYYQNKGYSIMIRKKFPRNKELEKELHKLLTKNKAKKA